MCCPNVVAYVKLGCLRVFSILLIFDSGAEELWTDFQW